MNGYDLTPTMRDVNKKFSVRYYLNLVLVDDEDRRYFKQQVSVSLYFSISFSLFCVWLCCSIFLLLAHYVPNVAKRSIWEQCKKKYILRTDRRPHIWENSNGHISARGRPIHFMFGSTVWFSQGRRIKWRYNSSLTNFNRRKQCARSN